MVTRRAEMGRETHQELSQWVTLSNSERSVSLSRDASLLFLYLSSRDKAAHALNTLRFSSGKRVAFPWRKPVETARSLFSKKYCMQIHHFV